jgi:MFS family permease
MPSFEQPVSELVDAQPFQADRGNHAVDATKLSRALRKARTRLGPLIALMFAVSILDRSNVGFAKEALRADVHIGDAAYAMGAGIFFIGYALFEIPSNLILHRIGARVWLSRIMVTWGIASAMMMLVTGPSSFYLLRFLVGLTEAGFSPGVVLYSTYWFPARERGKFLGIYYMGLPAALTVGSAFSGLIMERMNGYLGLHNWQWMFLIEGLAASLVGCVAYFALPSKPADARWLKADECDALCHVISLEESIEKAHSPSDSVAVLRDSKVLRFILIYFAIQVGNYGVIFYLPSRIAELMGAHINSRAGILVAIPWLCALISLRPICGWADKLGRQRQFAAVLLFVASIGIAASAQTTHLTLALFAFSLAAVGFVVVQPIFWTLPASYLRGTAAATGIAMIGACGNLGGFVAPNLKTAAENVFHNQRSGMLTLAAVALCGVVLLTLRSGDPNTKQATVHE